MDSDQAELPRKPAADRPYIDHLRDAFNTYINLATHLVQTDAVSAALVTHVPRLRELANRLLAAHEAVLNGRSHLARTEVEAALVAVDAELQTLQSNPLDQVRLGTLYRLRVAAPTELIDRGGMFHIPFDARHNVRPQRYSLLGIPMLYLGSTVFISWEEMGRPSMDGAWVCALRLRPGRNLRLINFGYRPGDIAAMLQSGGLADPLKNSVGLAYATLWPLIAACSFQRRFPASAFAEEYVIPQQVVAYLVESDAFDGIRYFSTRIMPYGEPTLTMNYALPARPQPGSARYSSRLLDLFEMTPPMPAAMVMRLGAPVNRGHADAGRRTGVLEAIPGHRVPYRNTEYSAVEGELEQHDFQPIV